MEEKNYLVLARKYRPKKLSHLIGQDEIRVIIEGALSSNRLAHAYLLSGTRGIGKTTLARIIAKAVNCTANQENKTLDPCGNCEACISIEKESNIDVIELDAASRTGINDVREIIENVSYKPVSAKKKVYIIDEAHMLSKSAFNALLKTLEEPPEGVLFLLATTETEKIPITIKSRCQHFELKRIPTQLLTEHIINISKLEKFECDQDSAKIIARSSEGSVRDALSILDNVLARGKKITKEITRDVLGLSDPEKNIRLFDFICRGNVEEALKEVESLNKDGASFKQLTKELIRIFYYVGRMKSEFDEAELGITEFEMKVFKNFSELLDMDIIIRFWELGQKYYTEIDNTFDQKQCFEMIVIRLCFMSMIPTPFETISKNFEDKKQIQEKDETKTKNLNVSEKVQDEEISKFKTIIKILEENSELFLSHQLTNNFELSSIKLPSENNGKGFLELKNLNQLKSKENLLWKISKSLEKLTNSRWIVLISGKSRFNTLQHIERETEQKLIDDFSEEKSLKKLLEIIPGSEIVSISNFKIKE